MSGAPRRAPCSASALMPTLLPRRDTARIAPGSLIWSQNRTQLFDAFALKYLGVLCRRQVHNRCRIQLRALRPRTAPVAYRNSAPSGGRDAPRSCCWVRRLQGDDLADWTSQQQAEFAALRRAAADSDYEMVAASFEILLSLDTPLLPLLDDLGRELWDDEDEEGEMVESLAQVFQLLEESAIPALATYVMEEEGPDLLVDLAAERLEEFSEAELLDALSVALGHPDERIREGVRDYLDEMAADSDAAEGLLDEIEGYE
jgi:hypothetical protein